MKKIFLTVCLITVSALVSAQIKPNERLVYAASYNMSGLMTHIAEVTMQSEIVNTSKKTYLHLSWEAATFSKWDSYFKIRDVYETYVDPTTLKPSLYKRSISEGAYVKTEKCVFNGQTVTSTSQKKNRPEVKKIFSVGSSTQDIISMIYKLRTTDISVLKSGQSKVFILVFDQKEYLVSVKMLGVETIAAGPLGKKDCYKMSISAKTDKLKGTDKNLIWLTKDAKKIPVLVRFSIPVGTGQMALTSATGI